MEKAIRVIEEIAQRGIIRAYAIGGGIAATYYIEPVLTYDLDIFFIPAKEGLDVLAPIYDFAKERGYDTRAEAILIEGFPVQFIPAYNDLVRAAVDDAAILKYRGVEAKVVKVEYLIAIALQTGRAKDKERVIRLLDDAVIDRAILSGILESAGLTDKFKNFESQFYGK
jgi:predicted nucleotidyltransferase